MAPYIDVDEEVDGMTFGKFEDFSLDEHIDMNKYFLRRSIWKLSTPVLPKQCHFTSKRLWWKKHFFIYEKKTDDFGYRYSPRAWVDYDIGIYILMKLDITKPF